MTDKQVFLASAVDQFRDAIAQKGMTPPNAISRDGKIHRFSSNGKPDDDAGWYVFYDGNFPTGAFGDFRTGEKVKAWRADIGRTLSPAENSDFKRKHKEAKIERDAKTLQLQADAKNKAARIMRIIAPADDTHPYLVKKNVKAHGIALWRDPVVSISTNPKTGKTFLQLVSKDGRIRTGFKIKLGDKSEREVCRPWQNILIVPMIDDSGASVYGIQVTNFSPTDKDLLEAEKIMASLRKTMEPTFRRPSAKPQAAKQSAKLET